MRLSSWRQSVGLIACVWMPLFAWADEPKAGTRADLYGDPLPTGAFTRLGTERLRVPNTGSVTMAFSANGQVVATGADNILRLWSTSDGRLLRQIHDNYEGAAVLFSTDGKWLATPAGGAICLLDSATGHLLQRIPVDGIEFAVSPDSKLLAITTKDGAVSLRNTADGKEVSHFTESKRPAILVQFTSDGKFLLAMTREKKLYRWELAKNKLDKMIDLPIPIWQNLTISSDGERLALTPANGTSAQIWNIEAGEKKYSLLGDGVFGRLGLAFSPDGKKLASDWRDAKKGENGIAIWDSDSGKLIRRIPVAWVDRISLGFAPDNQTLASFSGGAAVHLWDTSTGKPRLDLQRHTISINSLSFTPDGKYVVSAAESIQVWEAATGRHVRELPSHRGGWNIASILPNGRAVLSGGSDGMLVLNDIDTSQEIRRFPVKKETDQDGSVQTFALSPDGKTVSSFSVVNIGLVRIWDLAKDKPVVSRVDNSPINRFPHFSPDARFLMMESGTVPRQRPFRPGPAAPVEAAPPQIVIQNVLTGKTILTLTQPDPAFPAIAFTPDSQVLASTTFKQTQGPIEPRPGTWTIHLWELLTGKEQQSILLADEGERGISQMAFSPNQRVLAIARQVRTKNGGSENVIQFWDVATSKELLSRQGFGDEVTSLAFSADGKFLASGHADGSIFIWDAPAVSITPSAKTEPAELEKWWADMADEDARKAGAASWSLVGAGGPAVDFLRERVQPVVSPPPDQIKRWIADLDSKDFERRQDAARQLAALEELAQPALQDTLTGKPSAEQRRRIDDLLKPTLVVQSPEKRRLLRSIQVLERIGSPAARKLLAVWAQGSPDARLTMDAKAALERLDRRTVASDRGR
jgi:WD40 repeat protein